MGPLALPVAGEASGQHPAQAAHRQDQPRHEVEIECDKGGDAVPLLARPTAPAALLDLLASSGSESDDADVVLTSSRKTADGHEPLEGHEAGVHLTRCEVPVRRDVFARRQVAGSRGVAGPCQDEDRLHVARSRGVADGRQGVVHHEAAGPHEAARSHQVAGCRDAAQPHEVAESGDIARTSEVAESREVAVCRQVVGGRGVSAGDEDHAGLGVCVGRVVPVGRDVSVDREVPGDHDDRTAATFNCDNVTLNDVEVVQGVVQIGGRNGSLYSFKELRVMCTRIGVSHYKNRRKADMLLLIEQKKINSAAYGDIMTKKRATHRISQQQHIQCRFRLINIIFSDQFAGLFDLLGSARPRQDLDAAVSAEKTFWEDVAKAFADAFVLEYGQLSFQDVHLALDNCDIDPSAIVPLNAASLMAMWKKLKSDYAIPADKFNRSGHHNPDFFDYCDGRRDLLYLSLSLNQKPELTDAVEQPLPSEVFYESAHLEEGQSERAQSAATTKNGDSTAKRQRFEIADAIRELAQARVQANAASEMNAKLQGWFVVCDRLRDLQRQARSETDGDIEQELKAEIELLKKKRDKLEIYI